jgi:predicted nucleotidyltransferase
MFGLAAWEWQLVEDLLIKPLKDKGCQLYVFGSRARGDFGKFSDLDILISGAEGLEDLVHEINDALVESELPIKIDLVMSQELAKSYESNVSRERLEI